MVAVAACSRTGKLAVRPPNAEGPAEQGRTSAGGAAGQDRTSAAPSISVPSTSTPSASTPSASTPGPSAVPAPATFQAPGPYIPGVVTLALPDRSVEVWYPADPGVEAGRAKATYEISDWLPPAFRAKVPPGTAPFTTDAYRGLAPSHRGPFPLVLFSHGFGGYRDQSTLITTHLASWGFVVAAPDHLERGLASVFGERPAVPMTDDQVLRATADLLDAESARPGAELSGIVAPGRLAIVGHSAGGFAAIHFASQPDVVTYVSLAAGATTGARPTALADKASLYMVGALDGIVPEASVESTYARAPTPTRLVVLANAGHLAFADICLVGAGKGGTLAVAAGLGITVPPSLARLATDGCEPGRLPILDGTAVIDHFIVAQLRSAFGIDRVPVGLGGSVTGMFPAAPFTYRHQP